MILQSVNPATDEIIGQYNEHQWDELNSSVKQATEAQHEWMHSDMATRASALMNMARELRSR